ncbi:MAG: dihydrolipoyl dehydrogenase [Planctomycetota bacterium]
MSAQGCKTYDVAVIGGGPGGYVAAIRAAQLGSETVLIEKEHLGGVCGNVGCIPTKALIHAARTYLRVQRGGDVGVVAGEVSLDFSKTAQHRDRVVRLLRKGVEKLLDGNGVEVMRGEAQFEDDHTLRVGGDNDGLIHAEKVVIATGSRPFEVPGIQFDDETVMDSSVAVNLDKLPESLMIIGGGYIGCEFAAAFSAMDVEVTVVEMMDRILPEMDADCSREIFKQLKKQGATVLTGTKVEELEKNEGGIQAVLSDESNIECEKALISVGRRPNTRGLELENAGIETGENGEIEVNEHMQTSIPHIYGVGDVNGKIMLAHVASHEGVVAAAHINGEISAAMDYSVVPAIAFTHPELGTVGLTESSAEEQYDDVVTKRYPMRALGKAQVSAETEGFVKMVADSETGQILGVHIVSSEASNLIGEATLGLQLEVTAEELAETIHAHPTMPESLHEVAEGVIGLPVNWMG